jgi:hypothetical protein
MPDLPAILTSSKMQIGHCALATDNSAGPSAKQIILYPAPVNTTDIVSRTAPSSSTTKISPRIVNESSPILVRAAIPRIYQVFGISRLNTEGRLLGYLSQILLHEAVMLKPSYLESDAFAWLRRPPGFLQWERLVLLLNRFKT